MGEYIMCPNCGNTKKGDNILRCSECNKAFCSSCMSRGMIKCACPACGNDPFFGHDTLGEIK